MSLKKQTFNGVIWTFADTFLLKGLFFVASLILARILGPIEFGLMGMIAIFIAIGVTLVDSGLTSSIIRTPNADDKDFSTIFYMNMAMSLIVYIIFFFAAPFIALFFEQEILTNLIRLYCVSFIISAFSAVQLAILNKEMKFKQLMQYNIPGTVVGICVGVGMGICGFRVWSIVWMYLSTQAVQSMILWFFSSWRPTATFSKEKLKLHYSFGYKLMLSGLIDKIFSNSYNVIIGKFFPVQTLGYYNRAFTLNQYPVSIITGIIGKVTYPLLSKIQDDKMQISHIYIKILQFTFYITAPLMLGAAAVAKPLMLIILGEQWLPAVPFFQILCTASILYPIHAFNINVLKVYGRSDLFLKLEVTKKILIVISLFIGFQFGIYGILLSSVFVSFTALLINTHYSNSMIQYSTKNQLIDLAPYFFIASVMGLMMYGISNILFNYSLFIALIAASLAGIIIYLGMNYILKTPASIYAFQLLKERKI